MVFDASFLKFMLVETWIPIVVNCFANREHFDFLGRIAKICLQLDEIPMQRCNDSVG